MTARPWETGDERSRWNAYLLEDGRTLRNLVDARTPARLRQIEDDLVEARALTLREHGLPGSYDLDGLRAVHRHLFQDVYEWAGDVRTVAIRKSPRAWFAQREQIAPAMDQVAAHLRDTDRLRAIDSADVPRDLARVYNIVNHLHPFREGNGRAQREFVTALARESGHDLDWTQVTADRAGYESENDQASREAHEGDPRALYAMFERITTKAIPDVPRRSAAEAADLSQIHRLRAASYPSHHVPRRAAARSTESTSRAAHDRPRGHDLDR